MKARKSNLRLASSQNTALPTDETLDQRPRLSADLRDHLGTRLQSFYAAMVNKAPPPRLLALIERLNAVVTAQGTPADAQFRDELLAALPGLRAFAGSLTVNESRADDLVQETLLRAWANQDRFRLGSNLKAWLCTILRNQFYTECRKRKREVEDVDGVLAGQLAAPAAQEHGAELQKVWTKLAKLPPLQREALLLVAAQGLTYEAAANLVGCQVGTVKSRVSRARSFLAASLDMPATQMSA
jgi:RNA polymerase sigma-70 factor (ECF subfamily)